MFCEEKKIEEYVVLNDEVFDSMLNYTIAENKSNLVKEISSSANLYNESNCHHNNNIKGKIVGDSNNRFDKLSNDVHVSRRDNLYLGEGNLTLEFIFTTKYKKISDIPILKQGDLIEAIPTYKSGIYANKNIKVIIEVFQNHKIYKIIHQKH